MGVYIFLNVDPSVTQEEWKKVYEESLVLLDAFPLGEIADFEIEGVMTRCVVPTKEREFDFSYHKDKKDIRIGWNAHQDYDLLTGAEEFGLRRNRDFSKENEGNPYYDAITCMIEEIEDQTCYVFGNKTQGESYHMYILAIACMICDRLKNKAYVHGDITYGQCKKAVEMANQYLTDPIGLPDQCDLEKLYTRIHSLKIDPVREIKYLDELYLGRHDHQMKEIMEKYYTLEQIKAYWINKMDNRLTLREYLLMDFELSQYCLWFKEQINQLDNNEGQKALQEFIEQIMESKLYIQNKDYEDELEIDPDEDMPYSIYTIMAQLVFGAGRNMAIDRYIPLDELIELLEKVFGDLMDVRKYIKEYMEKEQEEENPSYSLKQVFNKAKQEITEEAKYDIFNFEDLLYFKTGNTILPQLEKAIINGLEIMKETQNEETYQKMVEENNPLKCLQWIVDQNCAIAIRDRDYLHILSCLKEDIHCFNRYYSIFRMKIDTENHVSFYRALMINDDLYQYLNEKLKGKDEL